MENKIVKVVLGRKHKNSIVEGMIIEEREDGYLTLKVSKVIEDKTNLKLLESSCKTCPNFIIEKRQIIG